MCLHILKLILALFGNMNFEKILECHSELDKGDDVGDNQSVDFFHFISYCTLTLLWLRLEQWPP